MPAGSPSDPPRQARRPSPRPIDPDSPDEAASPRPLHLRATALGLVLVGGTLGTLSRYGVEALYPTEPRHWPVGTFAANLAGSFVLGLLLEALVRAGSDDGIRQRLRLLVGTGFCGGFTTYSTLAVETALLARDHRPALALGYVAATALAGLAATVLGVAVATRSVRSS